MDKIDKEILSIIQKNSSMPLTELSKRIGISSTPCWNRIKRMEEEKIIDSKVAIINPDKINLPITVFLSISVTSHNEEWYANFEKTVMKYNQILEVYRVASSSSDYLLKIVSPSIDKYDEFQQILINEIEFTKMSSNISLKRIKQNNYLPLEYA